MKSAKPRNRGITYLLERIPSDIWKAARARAAKDGHPMRWILLQLVKDYAEGK